MLLIKTAYRKYFEAVTTPMLYFLCENISLKIEGKESFTVVACIWQLAV